VNAPQDMPRTEMMADAVARKVFAKRGNHSEAHVTELELAAIINAALLSYLSVAKQMEEATCPASGK
jgi:hypothetical protein